ncbi:MAG TPA: hypothetical protein VE993_14930, partial [Stellaceae bacterium]|nr:hypothetical protein [Stellaceae bacterium]
VEAAGNEVEVTKWTNPEDIVLVVAGYRRARTALLDELQADAAGFEVLPAGDCVAPRLLRNAVADGVRIGAAL